MLELINKFIDILEKIAPFIMGYFTAKQDTKIHDLKEENETLKQYEDIDNKYIDVDVAYNGMFK